MPDLDRRQLLTLLAASAGALTISPTGAQGPDPLQMTASPSVWQKAFEEVNAAAQGKHPGLSIALAPSLREDEEHAQRLLRNSITGDLPDLIYISNALARLLVDRGLAQPLDGVLDLDELKAAGLIEGVGTIGVMQDRLYGLPFGVSVPVLAYNADLVKRAGGDPDGFPQDWAAILDLVRRVQTLGDGVLGGFFEYDNTANWTFQALVNSHGGGVLTPDERAPALDQAAAQESLRILRAFAEAGQGRVDMTRDQARQSFSAGKLGVLVTSSGGLPSYVRQAGDRFVVRAARLPVPHANGRVPAASTFLMMLAKDAAKQRAVGRYARFVVDAEGQTIVGRSTGLMAVNRIALGEPDRLGRVVEERKATAQAVVESLPKLGTWLTYPGDNGIKITAVVKDHLQALLTLKQTPDAVGAAMARDVAALLPRS